MAADLREGAQDDARLHDIEARLAFQDDTIVSLNDALVNQQGRIAALERSMDVLIKQFRLQNQAEDEPPEEPPPHY